MYIIPNNAGNADVDIIGQSLVLQSKKYKLCVSVVIKVTS